MFTSELLYSSDPGLIIGFHGCDQEIRDRVVMHQTMLKSSKNEWDWLGDGMYFWQNNHERAFHFITAQSSALTILSAEFLLSPEFLLTGSVVLPMVADCFKLSYEILTRSIKRLSDKSRQLPRLNTAPKTAGVLILTFGGGFLAKECPQNCC